MIGQLLETLIAQLKGFSTRIEADYLYEDTENIHITAYRMGPDMIRIDLKKVNKLEEDAG